MNLSVPYLEDENRRRQQQRHGVCQNNGPGLDQDSVTEPEPTPDVKMASIQSDTSPADFVTHVLYNCGQNAQVVSTPATYPRTSAPLMCMDGLSEAQRHERRLSMTDAI